MIKKSTIITFGLMLVLIITLVVLQKNDALDFLNKPNSSTPTPVPLFTLVEKANIKGITYENGTNQKFSISQISDSEWSIDIHQNIISTDQIEQLISTVNAIKIFSQLDPLPDKSTTGVSTPTYLLNFSFLQ